MKFLTFAFVFFLANTSLVSNAQEGEVNTDSIKNKWQDIAYANISQAQKLDIYLPNGGNGPFPVIVLIHGGGYQYGDKRSWIAMIPANEGIKRSYAIVSINYRLVGEAKAPQIINDAKAAIRWLRANATKYNLKGDKMAVWGPSAGGHLSALVGTSGDVKELEGLSLGNESESSRVQAVVDWFGPINFLTVDSQFSSLGLKGRQQNRPESESSQVIGKNITDAPDEVKVFNPETYITKDDPPFFIQHGLKDTLVPYLQSTHFAEALSRVIGKDKVTLELVQGGHGGDVFSDPKNLQKVFAFLDKYLKN